MWRGGVGAAYLLPALSCAGASIASPCFRFHIPQLRPPRNQGGSAPASLFSGRAQRCSITVGLFQRFVGARC
jgi:hypothetical protein